MAGTDRKGSRPQGVVYLKILTEIEVKKDKDVVPVKVFLIDT